MDFERVVTFNLLDWSVGSFRCWYIIALRAYLVKMKVKKEEEDFEIKVCLLAFCVPLYTIVIIDLFRSWLERDILNIIRHSTILGPSLAAFLKMMLSYYKRVQTKEILDEMNRDYECYNTLPEEHQEIAYTAIKNNVLYTEKLWFPIVVVTITTFPGVAVVQTIRSQLFDEEPVKYMIHEVNLPMSEREKTFTSPYYELLNLNMLLSALICIVNYGSYDGFFALATNHACLKMRMYCKKLEDSFKSTDGDEMYKGLVEFVEMQKRLFRFVYLIQETFNIWLAVIFMSTMIHCGSLMYHISAGLGFDFTYTIYSITAVVHIFLPCKYAANLKCTSLETSTMIYCSGWENTHQRIRRVIPFLIARAQIPSRITVLHLMDFDMELFVFLMRTSYSLFTLIRS